MGERRTVERVFHRPFAAMVARGRVRTAIFPDKKPVLLVGGVIRCLDWRRQILQEAKVTDVRHLRLWRTDDMVLHGDMSDTRLPCGIVRGIMWDGFDSLAAECGFVDQEQFGDFFLHPLDGDGAKFDGYLYRWELGCRE